MYAAANAVLRVPKLGIDNENAAGCSRNQVSWHPIGFEHPSIVDTLAGCWRLTVRSGAVKSSLVVAAYWA